MGRPLVALLVILAPIAAATSRSYAAIEDETGSGAEGLKLVNAQMVRELASRTARLGTSSGFSDTTFVGYTPGHLSDNYWSIWAGLGKDGFKRPINGQPDKGTWDWEVAIHGDSLQGWWPLINQYASTGGQVRTDRNRPWWALDFGNMANYRINEANGRTFGVVGVWHRDNGSLTSAIPCPTCAGGVLPKPRWSPPSGSFAAWMGLRPHGDNSFSDPETGNPFNEDLLMYVGFNAVAGGGNDYFFPGYGSQMDQMLYRDIDFAGESSSSLTLHFKFQTTMSKEFGTTISTRTGWFDCDPLAFTGGATNPQPNNFISSSDAGDALAPRDSFMVYLGSGVDGNQWLGSDGALRNVYDPRRRWFGEVLHWDRDPASPPSNPQPRFYKELMSVAGDYPAADSANRSVFADTTFLIPNSVLAPFLAKNKTIRLVFRVKTNRGFDDMGTAYVGSRGSGAAIVDNVTAQVGANPVVTLGEFETASDIDNNPATSATSAWKSTGKPPGIFHHVHAFADLIYEDLCGQKGDVARFCDMSGVVISAGDHDQGETAGGLSDGTAQRERNDGIMSPTIQLCGPYDVGAGTNRMGLYPVGGNGGVGDIEPTEDYYIQYDIYTGIMNPSTQGNLWRFAIMCYPANARGRKGHPEDGYPAWGQMRFPGYIIFNPEAECFEDIGDNPGYANALIKTSNPTGIPDSLQIMLGKSQQCFRFGVSAGCSPTDGCYWDNVCFAIIDGTPSQLGVDIWQWINDAFPANETVGLPGTADFDTAGAWLKTGLNTAQSPGTQLRFDVPGDSTTVFSSPNTARVDMMFRVLPGPGNYEPIGRPDLGTIRKIPQSAAVVTKGDGSWWDDYRQVPGDFASPNAVVLHHNAKGGWDPNVWNSARCDTAEANLFANQTRGVLGGPPDPASWRSTYHESDPHFNTLGILRNRCFLRTQTSVTTDIICDGTVPTYISSRPEHADVTGTTKEGTRIIPDGLLTPGAHVEYFFRDQKDTKTPGAMDGMIPDTNVVYPQGLEGSTDGHRWQEFSVLPNRWKNTAYKHPVTQEFGRGPACMLVVDNNDRRGNERVWVSVSDTIGAVPQRYWGAHNGWHAVGNGDINNPADNRRGKDGSAGFVTEHLGQAGSGGNWDMYQVKASGSLGTSAGSLGSRLANRTGSGAQQIVIVQSSRQGPTPAMLAAYYNLLLFLSGDVNAGLLGPFANRSQNDTGIIQSWLGGATAGAPRGFWAIGDGFVESNVLQNPNKGQAALMSAYLGVGLESKNYITLSADRRILVDYKLFPEWQGKVPRKPGDQVLEFGIRNMCLWSNDVLKIDGVGLGTGNGRVTSVYHGGLAGDYTAGVYKPATATSPWIGLVDGWDIEHLTAAGDVSTLSRSSYFAKIFTNVWQSLCPVAGTPIVALDVPSFGDGDAINFVNLRNNPLSRGQATIHFGVTRPDRVEVKIYDVSGRLVRTLADRQFPAGTHDLVWDGADNSGNPAARGVYFTRVRYRELGFEANRKLTVLK